MLKDFDDTTYEDDEYETPYELFEDLCDEFCFVPLLDVASTPDNSICLHRLVDGLAEEWTKASWCNPPHSKTEQFVLRADSQFEKHGYPIMMIVPANAICAHFFDDIFMNERAKYYRISGRPKFRYKGRPTKYPPRNSYFVVVWQ